jgi:hypothetical protein
VSGYSKQCLFGPHSLALLALLHAFPESSDCHCHCHCLHPALRLFLIPSLHPLLPPRPPGQEYPEDENDDVDDIDDGVPSNDGQDDHIPDGGAETSDIGGDGDGAVTATSTAAAEQQGQSAEESSETAALATSDAANGSATGATTQPAGKRRRLEKKSKKEKMQISAQEYNRITIMVRLGLKSLASATGSASVKVLTLLFPMYIRYIDIYNSTSGWFYCCFHTYTHTPIPPTLHHTIFLRQDIMEWFLSQTPSLETLSNEEIASEKKRVRLVIKRMVHKEGMLIDNSLDSLGEFEDKLLSVHPSFDE